MFTVTIDWLSVTFKEITHEANKFLREFASASPIVDEPARLGYNTATRDKMGVLQMWHTVREEMGNHVVFGGSALRNICGENVASVTEIVKQAVYAGGHITRLDLAKDAFDEQIAIKSVADKLEKGEFAGTSKVYSRVLSSDGGETLYIGSRQSERFVRMYLKSVEQGRPELDWVRLEIELKGMQARSAGWVIANAEHDLDEVFGTILSEIVRMPNCGSWQKFITNTAKIGLPKVEKQTDREKWIETQVIPAVLKHYLDFPESPSVLRMRQELDFADHVRRRGKQSSSLE